MTTPSKDDLIGRLLGKELAQDDPNFLKYCIPRPDIQSRLENANEPFLLINAARGSGKSGFLLSLQHNVENNSNYVIKKFHHDAEDVDKEISLQAYVVYWKNQILGWIFSHIGSKTNFAVTESEINAVEFSQKMGEIGKPALSTILDKLKFSALPIERTKTDIVVREPEILRALKNTNKTYWVLLDEMDINFDNTKKSKDRLAGLLFAAQALSRRTERISIRITIRPHILTILQTQYDGIQTLREVEINCRWQPQHLRSILAKRFENFTKEIGALNQKSLPFDLTEDEEINTSTEAGFENTIISKFINNFDMSFNPEDQRPVYRTLATISFTRPRWLVEYLKIAFSKTKDNLIITPDVARLAMYDYGINRIKHLVGEHYSLCPQLLDIINQFNNLGKINLGKTDELKAIILERIIDSGVVVTPHYLREKAALEIAQLLYMIEFLRGKEMLSVLDDHRFYYYVDKPDLLRNWNVRGNVKWHLHPVFAKALNLDDDRNFNASNEVKTAPKRPYGGQRGPDKGPSKPHRSRRNKT